MTGSFSKRLPRPPPQRPAICSEKLNAKFAPADVTEDPVPLLISSQRFDRIRVMKVNSVLVQIDCDSAQDRGFKCDDLHDSRGFMCCEKINLSTMVVKEESYSSHETCDQNEADWPWFTTASPELARN